MVRHFCGILVLQAALFWGCMCSKAAEIKKVEIGEKQELRIDGKPFFPLIVWNQPRRLVSYQAELGMNTLVPGESPEKEGSRLELLDDLHKHNMYLFLPVGEYPPEVYTHPALLGWLHGDEPDKPEPQQYEMVLDNLPADSYVFFEGEQPKETNFIMECWLHKNSPVLSGGKWLGLDIDNPPQEPFYAKYEFKIPKDGEYNFFVREFTKNWASPTIWRIDNGDWSTTDRSLRSAEVQKLLRHCGVGWVHYGKVKLSAGIHCLEIQVKDGRTLGTPDKVATALLGGYDLFLFTTADNYPPQKIKEPVPWVKPEKLENDYRAIKAKDPNHPVWMNFTVGFFKPYQKLDHKWYHAFGKAADCLSFDHYPVTGWNRPDRVPEVASAMKEFVQLYPDKCCWAIIEASDQDLAWTAKNTRGPTPEEMRAEIWMAITAGAKGIGYFTIAFNPFRWNNLTPEIEQEIRRTNRQITKLAPAILSHDEGPKVVCTNSKIQYLVRRHEGDVYIFAVSLELPKANFSPKLDADGKATEPPDGETEFVFDEEQPASAVVVIDEFVIENEERTILIA